LGRSLFGFAIGLALSLTAFTTSAQQSNLVTDADGNGRFEEWWLQDWDGDGSGWTKCTGQNVPDPACKVAGERVYRDAADDINAVVYGTGAIPGKMEPNGVIRLPIGVVVVWPCYDARWPTGYNDPTATNDDLHDDPSDVAYSHCPLDPYGVAAGGITPRFASGIVLKGTGVRLEGSGRDYRYNTTANMGAGTERPNGRMEATYLVNDMGSTGTGTDNEWFHDTLDQKYGNINIGFWTGRATGPNNTNDQSGAGGWTGWSTLGYPDPTCTDIYDDTVGGAQTSGDPDGICDSDGVTIAQDIRTEDMVGSLCICDTDTCAGDFQQGKDLATGDGSFLDSLEHGDLLVAKLRATHRMNGSKTVKVGWYMLQDGDTVTEQGSCRTGAVDVPVGVWSLNGDTMCVDLYDNATGEAQVSGDPDGLCDDDGATTRGRTHGAAFGFADGLDFDDHQIPIGVVHEDFLNTSVTISNMTIAPQDWPEEPGGDCEGSAVPWIDADATGEDYDCDTGHLTRINGSGAIVIEDVVYKNSPNFTIDGDSTLIKAVIRDTDFYYETGKAILDGSWTIRNIRVVGGQFSAQIASMWGGYNSIVGMLVQNSSGSIGLEFNDGQHYGFFRDIRFENTAIDVVMLVECGARFNTVEQLVDVGRIVEPGGTTLESWIKPTLSIAGKRSTNDGCAPGFEVYGNTFDGIYTDLGRHASTGNSVLSIDPGNTPTAGTDGDSIYGNTFRNINVESFETDTTGCIVGVRAGAADNSGQTRPLALNMFDGLTSPGSWYAFGLMGATGGCDSPIDAADGKITDPDAYVPKACNVRIGNTETYRDAGHGGAASLLRYGNRPWNCSDELYAPGFFYDADTLQDCDDLPNGTRAMVLDDDGSCTDVNGVLTGGSSTRTECVCDAGTWYAL